MINIAFFDREKAPARAHGIHLVIYALIAAAAVGLDQLTKWLVVRNMAINDTIPLWEGVFHITRIPPNTGIAFSMFSGDDHRVVMIVITVLSLFLFALLGFYLWADRTVPVLGGVSLAMIVGGGIGNAIDRLGAGAVVDFLDFRLINFAVFNVGDSFVCVGAGLMVLTLVIQFTREYRNKKEKKEKDA